MRCGRLPEPLRCFYCGDEADTRACQHVWVELLCVACAMSNPDALCAGCLDYAMRKHMDEADIYGKPPCIDQ